MAETKEATKLKKITPKDVMGRDKFAAPTKAEHLFTVFGAASSARVKPTQYNSDQYVLNGRFKAIRNDGEEFTSLELYLPEPAQTIIAESVKPNPETGEVPPMIEFAYLIGIAPSKKGAMGYTWTCEPMMDEKAQDAVSAIENAIRNKIPKALPKPEAPTAAKK